MTQTGLGDALDLTFQQAKRYESGTNRIGAGRLYDLARVLDVSIGYFFEDIPAAAAAISRATKRRGKAKKRPWYAPDPMAKRETLELVRAYYKIEDADVRRRVSPLIEVVGPAGARIGCVPRSYEGGSDTMCKKFGLTLVIWFVLCGPVWAQGTEVQMPDGRAVLLHDDHTWEFKRPAPAPAEDTVEVNTLVENPSGFMGQEVVVTGTVTRFMGAYRLQSSSAQNTIVLDVDQARRADQIALEQALAGGFSKSVRVQVRGEVERSLITSRIVAEDLLVLPE